jgi:hypothetical protein
MFTSTISSLSIANVINIVTRTALSITDQFADERRNGSASRREGSDDKGLGRATVF